MGRGNFYMQGQAQSAIIHYETEFENEDGEMEDDEFAFDDLLECVTSYLEIAFPSLERCDNRRGGDAILENAHCEVFIDDYCNTLTVCVVPKDDDGKEDFHRRWCEKIKFLEALRDFDPYVRTSAWTSGRVFEPKKQIA
jgi:hypothetical protein